MSSSDPHAQDGVRKQLHASAHEAAATKPPDGHRHRVGKEVFQRVCRHPVRATALRAGVQLGRGRGRQQVSSPNPCKKLHSSFSCLASL